MLSNRGRSERVLCTIQVVLKPQIDRPASFPNILLPAESFGAGQQIEDPHICAFYVLSDWYDYPTVVDGDLHNDCPGIVCCCSQMRAKRAQLPPATNTTPPHTH